MVTRRILLPPPDDEWGPLPPHAAGPPRRRGWRWLERALLAIGLILLGYYGYVLVEARLYQAYEHRELEAILASAPERPDAAESPPAVIRRSRPTPGSAIGRIEIPRLGVSTVIRAGSDARTLRLAVGHIPGTALPGEEGNSGLAGHRDTFFRRLRDIQPDDQIRIVTPDGTFTFRVQRTNVVRPQDTWVLSPTTAATLAGDLLPLFPCGRSVTAVRCPRNGSAVLAGALPGLPTREESTFSRQRRIYNAEINPQLTASRRLGCR